MKSSWKKIISVMSVFMLIVVMCTGCGRQSDRVSYNVSKEADNFNVVRRLTVINARTDKPVFELIGTFSIETDAVDHQLEVICETGKNEYKKHFISLNEWTIYVVEDIGGADVNKYRYEVNFLPEMILPVTVTNND